MQSRMEVTFQESPRKTEVNVTLTDLVKLVWPQVAGLPGGTWT